MKVGGNADAPAGGNARVGPAFADQVARPRSQAEVPNGYALLCEKRPGGSGQFSLRSTMEGLIATACNAVSEAGEVEAGVREAPTVSAPTCAT